MQRYVNIHINEIMKCHKFCRQTQQQQQTFDNYLSYSFIVISLRKLKPKLLDFALIAECKKYQIPNHWGPAWWRCCGRPFTSELTLTTTVTKCRSKEAAKKNQSQMTAQEQVIEMVVVVNNLQPGAKQRRYHICLGCGGTQHKGGCIHCPAYEKVCSCCHKVSYFARVCRSKERPHQQVPINNSSQPIANIISLQSPQGDHIQLYDIAGNKAEPVAVQMTLSTRTPPVIVLLDSGTA